MKKTKVMAWLLALAMTAQTFLGMPLKAEAAVDPVGASVTQEQLTDNETEAPTADDVVPDGNQYKYQKDELAAFCHFGPNTFSGYEWGYDQGTHKWLYEGMTPDEIFRLETDFDAETLVNTLKEAGFKKLIVTAKHHDGFCIWNSALTEYDIAATSYKNGQGDILAEISEACTAVDMDMGLYLSPWDVAEESYGANGGGKDNAYNDYYNNQLEEILSSDKYGNGGHFVEVWMDGANGYGNSRPQQYDFVRWFDTIQQYEGKEAGYKDDCMLFGAGAYTTVRWIGNENGFAHEETWSKSNVDKNNNTINSNNDGSFTKGFPNGNQWTVPECDARITSGWFWGTNKKTPKSMEALADMYFRSVGHNAPLLLNIPPNDEGKVDQAILDRVAEFGRTVQETFANNMAAAEGVTWKASEVRGNDTTYSPANVLDDNDATYWTVDDNTDTATLELDLGGTKQFDVVSIEEAIEFGQRIGEYKVEYKNGEGSWQLFEEGTTVGAKRLCRKAAVRADKVRITVKTHEQAKHREPVLNAVGIYRAAEAFALGNGIPEGLEIIDDRQFAHEGWREETGSQFLNNTGMWRNPANPAESGAATVQFTGTKIWLVGTVDSGHGTADIYIDDEKVATINTKSSTRKLQQRIFESKELAAGPHTLKVVPTSEAIGIDAALVLGSSDGSKTMFDFEQASYTVNEETTARFTINRTGDVSQPATVDFEVNPGTAIQKHFDTAASKKVSFEAGQRSAEVTVGINRDTDKTGDLYFTIELVNPSEGTITGFHTPARVTIIDDEGITADMLEALIAECEALDESNYTADTWKAFSAALADAKQKLESGTMTSTEIRKAMTALKDAKAALKEKGIYSEDDRFRFPTENGASAVLEAELMKPHNNTEKDNGYPLKVTEASWASGGKFLNSLNDNDEAVLYYIAPNAGTYTVTVQFRSGNAQNGITWTEESGKIKAGSVTAGASDSAGATHTAEFTFEVQTPGKGKLVFKGAAGANAPQLDKFDIVAKELTEHTHTWGEWETAQEPTCTEDGMKIRHCPVCDETETEKLPASGHQWSEWETTKEATTEEAGLQERHCMNENCNAREEKEIPKLSKPEELPAPELSKTQKTDTSITVEWKPSADSRVKYYKVAVYDADGKLVKELEKVEAVKATVAGLKPGTTYTFKVTAAAIGEDGKEILSKPLSVTTATIQENEPGTSEPQQPQQPPQQGGSDSQSQSGGQQPSQGGNAKTGDNAMTGLYAALAMGCLAALAVVAKKKRQ